MRISQGHGNGYLADRQDFAACPVGSLNAPRHSAGTVVGWSIKERCEQPDHVPDVAFFCARVTLACASGRLSHSTDSRRKRVDGSKGKSQRKRKEPKKEERVYLSHPHTSEQLKIGHSHKPLSILSRSDKVDSFYEARPTFCHV